MMQDIKNFPRTHHAKELLGSVSGKHLQKDERTRLTIELAAHILSIARYFQTSHEKAQQEELSRMMNDPIGKFFITAFTDQSFRSKRPKRIAAQMIYVMDHFGIPQYLPFAKRLALQAFKFLGPYCPRILVPLAISFLRKETSRVIIPGEKEALTAHIKKRKQQHVKLNLNHLGEAILGEEEAQKRLEIYFNDLKQNEINYVSVKISTIYSQINMIAFAQTVDKISHRLRQLYKTAIQYPTITEDGHRISKFVNLDMEEYRDLHITKEVFKKVLSEDEFKHYSAGIVLQAYIPDSFVIQQELTKWAEERVKKGGAPIKIRIVKGANLAMEQFEASVRGWSQAPFNSKLDTDANYKRMVEYALKPEHAQYVHIGIGSHNLFDIAYAMILRSENKIEQYVSFEMLEGMAEHVMRVVQELSGSILLYCAVATKHDFQSAIAYLIRRLDENTGPENFLRHMFDLKPGTESWETQSIFFKESLKYIQELPSGPRRKQNRFDPPKKPSINDTFENEADTDFSLPQNIKWAHDILHEWENKHHELVPLVIASETISQTSSRGRGVDPSKPNKTLYEYALAEENHIEKTIASAKHSESSWSKKTIQERCELISKVAQVFREKRADFIGVMIASGGKTIVEADTEFSEAIDFAEYYLRCMQRYESYEDLSYKPIGTILITPPWNFPTSIPAGGIVAALITGNCVIFKPAPEAVLSGWYLVQAFWKAGIPKEVLQFINCEDEPYGSMLIKDPRINGVILTGATTTAKLFLKMRPDLSLFAETGGKNAFIITAMADRDLAIKDLLHSAFGHSGQKCSAASLAILEKEVYDDPHFMKHLKDAAASLKVGSAWDPANKVTPMVKPPEHALLKGLTHLDPGESWLLEPKQDPSNAHLWSPGIKLGVKKGSFTQQTELFGPVLGIMRASNLEHAIQIANSTPYGLTAGLHSLDEREQIRWQNTIIAGNCYINRTITGAIVQRQPFGGCKKSSFGNGAKAGGSNYLLQFMHIEQKDIPQEKSPVNDWVNNLSSFLEKFNLTAEELGLWYASIANYSFWWQRLKRDRDPTKIVGQDNIQRYVHHKKLVVRIYPDNAPLDYLRIFAAALTTETHLQVSWKKTKAFPIHANWQSLLPIFNFIEETDEELAERIKTGEIKRIRFISTPSKCLYEASSQVGCYLDYKPVLANGRIELLHFLREVSLSIDYHRYGNLAMRETEIRKSIQ